MPKVDAKSLIHLEKYVSVLTDTYPQPVRATELAKKTHTSKPAITKIKDRLMQICDVRTFAFEHGFVLSFKWDVLYNLFIVSAANKHHKQFLSSRFVKAFLNSKHIHVKITSAIPLYAGYFTEDDTNLLLDLILDNLSNIDPDDFAFLMKAVSMQPTSFTENTVLISIQKIITKLEFKIRNEEEMFKVISLRDKFFFLLRDSLWAYIQNMKILETLQTDERDNYIEVYKNTIDFYLRRIFEGVNEPISKAAAKSSLRLGHLSPVGATLLVGG